jgi:hypothetical protein
MTAVYQKLAPLEQPNWSPGDVLTFEVPSTIPWCDLTKSRCEFTITPTATPVTAGGVAALTTPAGAAGFVQNIRVSNMQGMVLEEVRDFATLAMCMQSATCGSDTSAYRNFAYGESRFGMFDWIVRDPLGAAATTYMTRRIYLDLSQLLGVFKWATWPNAAAGGLRVQITLNAAEAAFKRYDHGGSPIGCDNIAAGAANFSFTTQNAVDQGVHPMIDFNRSTMEPHFAVGDFVVAVFTETGALTARAQTLTSATYTADGRMTLEFAVALPNADLTGITVFRHASAAALTFQAATGTYVDTEWTSINACPYFVNQEIACIVQLAGAGAYQQINRYIASITLVGGVVRLTFNAALGVADAEGFIRGIAATAVDYTVVDARMRVRTVMPPVAAMEQLRKGMSLDIVSHACSALQSPAGATSINYQLPVAGYMTRALAFIVIPVHASGVARFDTRTRGIRSFVDSYRFTCDGQSDPVLPISSAAVRPPVHDANVQRVLAALAAATDGTLGPLRVLYPGRQNWAFMKALNYGGLPRNIAGTNCELACTASAALPALELRLFTVHLRTLEISETGIRLV